MDRLFNSDSSRELKAYSWINRLLPKGKISKSERTQLIYHLIGTDRAFGTLFPEFFLDKKIISSNSEIDSFFRLFLFSRAYLIAHDAIRDKDRSNEIRKVLEESELLFRKECLVVLQNLINKSVSAEAIMKLRDEITERAYSSDFLKRVPSAEFVCERVSYWHLVFDALEKKEMAMEKKKRLFYLSLFLLQLADDFSDIDEDNRKEKNYNLLAWNKGKDITLSREVLESYALISIWYSAKQIINEFGCKEPMSQWAEEVLSLIFVSDEEKLKIYCESLFRGDWPNSYLPPHLNSHLKESEIPEINFITMNGVKLSAESLNSFASNRAINKMFKLK